MNPTLLKAIEDFGKLPSTQRLDNKKLGIDGYKTAIIRAVRDLTTRTLKPKLNIEGKLIDEFLLESESEKDKSFLKEIESYFNADPLEKTKFDTWHNNLCNKVLDKIKKYYTNQDGSDVLYGKAQKIVNMTLKGCYCLDGAREKEAYFAHCHMALDSFTLAWYNHNAKKEDKVSTAWSKLTEEEYLKIKTVIRTIKLDKPEIFKDLTPLKMEFLIWPLEIMINTVNTVNDCFGGFVKEDHAAEYLKVRGKHNDLIMANLILGKISYKDAVVNTDFITWLNKTAKMESRKKAAAAQFLIDKYGFTNE